MSGLFKIVAGGVVKKAPRIFPKMARRTRVIVPSSTGEIIGTPLKRMGKRARKPVGGRPYKVTPKSAIYVKPPTVRAKQVATKQQLTRMIKNKMSKRDIISGYRAEESSRYTRLYESGPHGERGRPQDMQFGLGMAAMRRAEAGKGPQMIPERGYIPPADVMGPKGLERRVFSPVEPEYDRAITGAKALQEDRAARELQELRVKRRQDAKVQSSVSKARVENTPTEELMQAAHKLDQVWKQVVGGRRTLVGRMWDRYREGSRGRHKVKDTRDYFIRVGLKWLDDPKGAAKVYPRESKSLEIIFRGGE